MTPGNQLEAARISPDQAMQLLSSTWLASRLARMTDRSGRPTIPNDMAMADRQRREVREAEHALRSSLTERPTKQAVSVEIARVIASFPMANGAPEATTKLRMDGFLTAVSDIPAWALRRAVDDVLRGVAPGIDARFAPNPPQLANLAREHMKPVMKAANQLRMLLRAEVEAPPVDDATRARMAQRMDELRNSLKRAG